MAINREYSRRVSFDIKFTRLGQKMQTGYILFISLPIGSDYDMIIEFCVDSASLATSFKKCNVIKT